ncbi:calcium-dependent protein kinase 28 [Tanacetum coccineum]
MGICLSTTNITGLTRTTPSDTLGDDTSTGETQQQPQANDNEGLKLVLYKNKNTNRNYNHKQEGIKIGYLKNFDKRFSTGKLLGHGQFGYTYVAIDKANGDRVAVKKIDKNKWVLPIAVEDVKRRSIILQALTVRECGYVSGGELLDTDLSKERSLWIAVGSAYYGLLLNGLNRRSGTESDVWSIAHHGSEFMGDASLIHLDILFYPLASLVKISVVLKQFGLRISDLKDQFYVIDVVKSGAISLEEMRQALAKDIPWKMKESRVSEILQIDSNTVGLVDFTEFIAATLHVH